MCVSGGKCYSAVGREQNRRGSGRKGERPRLPQQEQIIVAMVSSISPNPQLLEGQSPVLPLPRKILPVYLTSTFQLANPSLMQFNKQLSCSTRGRTFWW